MPEAAIELIHKQPVRWTHERVVACDGGGGPLGHPRIFINTDKPQICMCTYCGLPFVSTFHAVEGTYSFTLPSSYIPPMEKTLTQKQANEHHRAHLESLPETAYPLEAQGNPAEVPESQRITGEALGQR